MLPLVALISCLTLLTGLLAGLVIGARAGFLALQVAARVIARDRSPVAAGRDPGRPADIALVA